MKQKQTKTVKQAEEIKIGDYVTMNDRYRVSEKNKGRVFKVVSEPQDIGGTTCVFLDDYRGAYAADGLTKVHAVCSDKTAEKASDVSRATTIKQLVGLAVSNISEELLEKAVTNVQTASDQKEQVYKALAEARLGNLDYEVRKKILSDLEKCEAEYDAACFFFTITVLGQVFTWLEGAGK